jgi:hypothetical protein
VRERTGFLSRLLAGAAGGAARSSRGTYPSLPPKVLKV